MLLDAVKEMGLMDESKSNTEATEVKKSGLSELVKDINKSAEKMYAGVKSTCTSDAFSPIMDLMVPEKATHIFERLTSSFKYSSGKDWISEVGAKVKNSTMANVMNTIIDNAVKTRIAFESKDKRYIIKDFIEQIMNKEIIIESDGREVIITVVKTKAVKKYSAMYFLLEGKL
jgi:hypothetical protein